MKSFDSLLFPELKFIYRVYTWQVQYVHVTFHKTQALSDIANFFLPNEIKWI